MSLTVKNNGTEFKSVEPGTYVGICYRIVDLGTQHSEYQGKPNTRQQILISWELPTELIEEGEYAGQPYAVSKFYTASLGEKANLRKDLESWRGRAFTEQELQGFSLTNILGKPCLISVVQNENGKTRVGAIMALAKGTVPPNPVNEKQVFDIDTWDEHVFASIPDGIKKIIMESDEAKARFDGGTPPYAEGPYCPPDDDDIPF